jgi:hypothetical protein
MNNSIFLENVGAPIWFQQTVRTTMAKAFKKLSVALIKRVVGMNKREAR